MHDIDDLKEAIRTVLVAGAFVSACVTGLVLLVAVLTGNTDKILEWGAGQIVEAINDAVVTIVLGALRAIGAALWAVVMAVRALLIAFAVAMIAIGTAIKSFQDSLGA